MIFLVTAAAISGSGYALLRTLCLLTGRLPVDVPLSWFAGSAWIGFASFTARGLLGIPTGPGTALSALVLPFVAWGIVRRFPGWRSERTPEPGGQEPPVSRWIPRPTWLFAPMVAWTVIVAAAVVLHGLNTPVHTDDAYRVRAFAPILAATGAWNAGARDVIVVAGPIPTYVPALAWTLGAGIDPVHVSASILLTFLALLALVVALGATRGFPEAGWGAAFAITSIPFFAYHATSTYSDAWLGMFLAAAFAFLVAYGRGGASGDASRTILLLLGTAMVKREGELVALPVVAVLLGQVFWTERPRRGTLVRVALLLSAYAFAVAARVAAVGFAAAFPFVRAAAERTAATGASAVAIAAPEQATAGAVFVRAVFVDGELGILWWVLLASLVLLLPRVGKGGLGWALVALALVFAETMISAVWLYPQFTVNHATVHRSLLPVSAAGAVWLAWLLADACRPVTAAVPPAPPSRREAAARRRSRESPRRRGG